MALRERLGADVRAVVEDDPATGGTVEAVLTSPGLWARWIHRLASLLWSRGHRLLAGVIATVARLVTGIELHPGADVGERVVIDHGQGLVVGETAVVGDGSLLYHGVTLGAKEVRAGKRHPTLGEDVTVGAGATVLGDVRVGDGATIGAGAVVVDDVPAGETVVGVPAEPVGDREDTETAAVGRADGSGRCESDRPDDGSERDSDERDRRRRGRLRRLRECEDCPAD